MANTYTSGRVLVSDGDTTSHDTSKDEPINILSAEARWVGVTDTTSGAISYPNQTGGVDAITIDDGTAYSIDHPSRPANTNYDKSTIEIESNSSGSVDIRKPDGTVLDSHTFSAPQQQHTFSYSDSDTDGGTVEVVATNGDFDCTINNLATFGTQSGTVNDGGTTTTATNTDTVTLNGDGNGYTLTANYPSIPSDKQFLYHQITFTTDPDDYFETPDYTIDRDGDGTIEIEAVDYEVSGGDTRSDQFTVYPKQEGTTVTLSLTPRGTTTDADGGTIELQAQTIYADGSTNPSVGGDVSASYSGTLDNNEPSGWQTMSGLAANQTNTFDHSVTESEQVYFEFRYDWEYQTPDVLYLARVHENGTTYDLPLVNPQDSLLAYNNTRTVVEGTIVAADLVDTDNVNASPVRVHIPNHGTKAWRKNV